ncbi:MAG: hypothetical protein FJW35_09320 [Acidobacteria bacterium]|nr:hypothetical protein [Acidobacteriota bacterium]
MAKAGRVGDLAKADPHPHGCPGCPHPAVGPAIIGSPDVLINFMPALRITDVGTHMACCGPNMWMAQKGSSTVLINYLPAHRMGDPTMHCATGPGNLSQGSPDVDIGG